MESCGFLISVEWFNINLICPKGQKQWHSIVALDHGIELWLESWHSWLLPLSFEYCVEISIIE